MGLGLGLGLRVRLALEKSSRERLSWQPSRPDCSSRTSLGWPGSPSRSSELGSLFTLLPLPDASSRAWATCVCSAAGAIICSGERSSSAAMAAAATPPVCSRGGGAAAGAMRERGPGVTSIASGWHGAESFSISKFQGVITRVHNFK